MTRIRLSKQNGSKKLGEQAGCAQIRPEGIRKLAETVGADKHKKNVYIKKIIFR